MEKRLKDLFQISLPQAAKKCSSGSQIHVELSIMIMWIYLLRVAIDFLNLYFLHLTIKLSQKTQWLWTNSQLLSIKRLTMGNPGILCLLLLYLCIFHILFSSVNFRASTGHDFWLFATSATALILHNLLTDFSFTVELMYLTHLTNLTALTDCFNL